MNSCDDHFGAHVDGGACVTVTDGGSDVIDAGDEGVVLDDEGDDRPDDCDCGDWNADADLPCWPCYRAGFDRLRAPNSAATSPGRFVDKPTLQLNETC